MCTISEKKRSLIKQMTVLCEDVVISHLTDLTANDVPNILLKPDGTRFLWACQRCGTHLLWVDNINENDMLFNIEVVNQHNHPYSEIRWNYYDGEVLRPVTAKEILTGKFWKA